MGQGMPPSRQKLSLVPPASLLKSHDSIVAVLFATWVVVQTELDLHKPRGGLDIPVVHK